MALSDIILKSGKIIVALSSSTQGIEPAGSALNFGIIQRVNDLSIKSVVGTSVWFDITKSIPFTILSGIRYYLVDETDVMSSETAL